MPLTIGVDVGNAQLRAAVVDTEYDKPTPDDYPDLNLYGEQWALEDLRVDPDVINKIVKAVEAVAGDRKAQIQGVGVAYTGAISGGFVFPNQADHPPATRLLRPLKHALSTALGNDALEVAVENRSNMGAWGEYRWGQGSKLNAENLVYVTVSGIVGAGIVANKLLYEGQGFAGEFGHVLLDPSSPHECKACNQHGCVSVLAGGRALVRETLAKLNEGVPGTQIKTVMASRKADETARMDVGHALVTGATRRVDIDKIDARAVLDAAGLGGEGAQAAVMCVKQMAGYLGRTVAQIVAILDPRVIVLGGIASDSTYLLTETVEEARKYLLHYLKQRCELENALLGDQSPIFGAALWVWDRPHHRRTL